MKHEIFLLSLHEIQKRFERPRYVKQLKQQLAKDLFVLEQDQNTFQNCEDFPGIYRSLSRLIKKHIVSGASGLMNFLYRVDVNEDLIKEALSAHNKNADELLAELIIKRELEKILLREKFS